MTTYFRLRLVAMVTRQALKNVFYWSHTNQGRHGRFWAGKTAIPPPMVPPCNILQYPGKAALPLRRPCKLREKSQSHLFCFSIDTIHYLSRLKNWISFKESYIIASMTSLNGAQCFTANRVQIFAKNLMWVKQFFDDYCSDLSTGKSC